MTSLTSSKVPWDRIKLVLIPVLGLVLVGVLYWPSPDSAASPAPSLLTQLTSSTLPTIQGSPTNAKPKIRWKEYSLGEVTAFSPFDPLIAHEDSDAALASTTAAEGTEAASNQAPLNKAASKMLKTGPVQAIYHDGRNAVAIINSRLVHPGDLLEEGLRVVEITSEGVFVELP